MWCHDTINTCKPSVKCGAAPKSEAVVSCWNHRCALIYSNNFLTSFPVIESQDANLKTRSRRLPFGIHLFTVRKSRMKSINHFFGDANNVNRAESIPNGPGSRRRGRVMFYEKGWRQSFCDHDDNADGLINPPVPPVGAIKTFNADECDSLNGFSTRSRRRTVPEHLTSGAECLTFFTVSE